MNEVNK